MLFDLIAHPLLPWVFSVAIIVTAVILWFRFRYRVTILRRSILRATSEVEKADGQVSFKKRFPSVFKVLSDDEVIGNAWRAYAATIESAPTDSNILGYSRRPAESFNDSIATASGLNLRFFQAVPNILVGSGLLFTFLGLVGALHFASAGVAAGNVDEAQEALRLLLSTATFKFVSSITGLASSLVFSWKEKSALARFEQDLARFCAALEARMTPITTEALLAASLIEMREQKSQFENFGKRRVTVVSEEMESEVRQAVREATARLEPSVNEVAKKIATLDQIVAAEIKERLQSRPQQDNPVDDERAQGLELENQQLKRRIQLDQAEIEEFRSRDQRSASGETLIRRFGRMIGI